MKSNTFLEIVVKSAELFFLLLEEHSEIEQIFFYSWETAKHDRIIFFGWRSILKLNRFFLAGGAIRAIRQIFFLLAAEKKVLEIEHFWGTVKLNRIFFYLAGENVWILGEIHGNP